ncbi:MAG: sulfotransferase family 2 domain-containing protein [Rhodobacteraceae bacterium]|nr:sulfotransferase family 2 domain-containing protein [Paracoccaceae bacterium]
MIISHDHGFVFVKPMKVAGSSVENSIYPLLGDKDLVGHNGPENLKILRDLGKNCRVMSMSHASAEELIARFMRRIVKYKFISVARNPWDRAVSLFYWRNKNLRDLPLDELRPRFHSWVQSGRVNFEHIGSPFWRGYPAVDLLVKYETLAEGFREVSRLLDLPSVIDTEKHFDKAGVRPARSRNFTDLYDDATWKTVEILGAREIQLFGYSREKPAGDDRILAEFDALPLRQRIIATSKQVSHEEAVAE